MTKLNSQTKMTKSISRKITISNLECSCLPTAISDRSKDQKYNVDFREDAKMITLLKNKQTKKNNRVFCK